MDEKLKAAFEKVRKDIEFLAEEMKVLRRDIDEIKANFTNKGSIGNEGVPTDKPTHQQTDNRHAFDTCRREPLAIVGFSNTNSNT